MSDNRLSESEVNILETIMGRTGGTAALLAKIGELSALRAEGAIVSKHNKRLMCWRMLTVQMKHAADVARNL